MSDRKHHDRTRSARPAGTEFRPAWFARGAHTQTLWGKLFRRIPAIPPTRLERWDTPDGDFIDVIRLDPAAGWEGGDVASRPRLLVLHGLEGGMRSHYAQGLFLAARRLGWGMDLMLHRSCGDEPNRARRFYHSGETEDAAFVIARVCAERPDAPVGVCGVSLGGNMLLKYLGERGTDVPPQVAGAVAVSVPFDLARGSRHIARGFSRVYEAHFLRSLRRKVEHKLQRYPDLVERDRLARLRTLWDFDDVVTAPVHGFRDAADYYARSSSLQYLPRVRTPTLLLSAVDDPFLPAAVLDDVRAATADNDALELEFAPRGGHVGFVAGRVPWRVEYYAERRTFEFLEERVKRRRAARNDGVGGTAHG